ncbi:hypothetical protein LP420_36695 [Massilia sp. B-10]|nr:hypothetical protein LP420_36695 [Massilia sp. B-10]
MLSINGETFDLNTSRQESVLFYRQPELSCSTRPPCPTGAASRSISMARASWPGSRARARTTSSTPATELRAG